MVIYSELMGFYSEIVDLPMINSYVLVCYVGLPEGIYNIYIYSFIVVKTIRNH